MNRIVSIARDGVRYLITEPSYPLRLWVDHFFIGTGFPVFQERRVFPNNHVDIFFNLGDSNTGKLCNAANDFKFTEFIVSGLRTSYLEIKPSSYFNVIGMRFTLFGFSDLFDLPASEIADQNYMEFDFLEKGARTIYFRLKECTSIKGKFEILEKWLLKKIRWKGDEIKIWSRSGQLLKNPVTDIQSELKRLTGFSHKHTVKLFREKTGLTPKVVQKIFRFNILLKKISTADAFRWSDLVFDLGYADQSHMIREFKQFSGFTPVNFQRQHTVSTFNPVA
jgi:AraC-like DNA-binding protein